MELVVQHLYHGFLFFSHLSEVFNEDFWSLLSFSLFFICFFPTFLSLLKLVPLLECAVEIVKHVSFVFWHAKNAISQSPFVILHIVCLSGKDLTYKLLLLSRLPVCLPVSSMLKLCLLQFLFYKTAPFFP